MSKLLDITPPQPFFKNLDEIRNSSCQELGCVSPSILGCMSTDEQTLMQNKLVKNLPISNLLIKLNVDFLDIQFNSRAQKNKKRVIESVRKSTFKLRYWFIFSEFCHRLTLGIRLLVREGQVKHNPHFFIRISNFLLSLNILKNSRFGV